MSAELGLGTVQFGLDYGVSNRSGKVGPETVAAILERARVLGVRTLDTAMAYGDAETVLGRHDLSGFNVVTKWSGDAGALLAKGAGVLVDAVAGSLERLGVDALHGLMLHNTSPLCGRDGEAVHRHLQEVRDQGLASRIGVSFYAGSEIATVLERGFDIDICQVPVNVIDQRLVADGSLDRLGKAGVEVHVRSAFLQGLLLMPPATVPASLAAHRPVLERFHAEVAHQGLSASAAALRFVRDLDHVHTVVIGVSSLEEFEECARDFAGRGPFAAAGLGSDDPSLVDPREWAN
jgi:hypothetical protein